MMSRVIVGLMALFLSACATLRPVEDSMRGECPHAATYQELAATELSLPALQALASARLAPLGLLARWQGPLPYAQAQPFDDSWADRQRLRRLLTVMLPSLERYPLALFKRIGLRHVDLRKDLSVTGQLRMAMPSPGTDSVAYADNGVTSLCLAGVEARVHHELYHLIEHRLFGDFYFPDPQWLALNAAGTRYGEGGVTAYGKGFLNSGHPQPGWVSLYAGYGPEEDKAEVFAWMMTPGYASRVRHWAEEDQVLAAKRRFMTTLVAELSDGVMDEDFFERLAQAL